MRILFLHGWPSVPGGVKPTGLNDHGHQVLNPKQPDDDFAEAVWIAQAEFDTHRPRIVVGSSRGGTVAMNIGCEEVRNRQDREAGHGDPAQPVRRRGAVRRLGRAGENSEATLIEVGTDHRLADPEPLAAVLRACEGV